MKRRWLAPALSAWLAVPAAAQESPAACADRYPAPGWYRVDGVLTEAAFMPRPGGKTAWKWVRVRPDGGVGTIGAMVSSHSTLLLECDGRSDVEAYRGSWHSSYRDVLGKEGQRVSLLLNANPNRHVNICTEQSTEGDAAVIVKQWDSSGPQEGCVPPAPRGDAGSDTSAEEGQAGPCQDRYPAPGWYYVEGKLTLAYETPKPGGKGAWKGFRMLPDGGEHTIGMGSYKKITRILECDGRTADEAFNDSWDESFRDVVSHGNGYRMGLVFHSKATHHRRLCTDISVDGVSILLIKHWDASGPRSNCVRPDDPLGPGAGATAAR